MPEILAPVANESMLAAAIQAGANAVYFGVAGLNMRNLGGKNFTLEELEAVVKRCHKSNVRAYLTVNTIIYEGEEKLVENILTQAKKVGVDAIIAWDMQVIKKAVSLGLEVHLSTQASVANYEALKFYYEQGVKRFVLARELDLPMIKKIISKIKQDKLNAEIECFIHGAMCIAVSGRCFMSQIAHDKSANRGECLQMCRRSYVVKDTEEDTEFELEGSYVMSPKDLCAMPIIDKLIDAGIDVFKIEGRARSPEYVKIVTESYKKAVEEHKKGKLTEELKTELIERMQEVYNRGLETGFYMGKPMNAWAGVYGSKATKKKVKLGKVQNYYQKTGIVEVKLETLEVSTADDYLIIGPTTGVIEGKMPEIWLNDKKIKTAKKGDIITFEAPKTRKNDDFYKVVLKE